MITMGYDVGTRLIKVCVQEDGEILGHACHRIDSRHIGKVLKKARNEAIDKSSIKKSSIKKSYATGFGSSLLDRSIHKVSEAFCMVKAGRQLSGNVKTIVDVGGLFINIATLTDKGLLDDSEVNEKCAAGSGKFVEMISGSLHMELAELSSHARLSADPYMIKNNCAVFSESEAISEINSGRNKNDIIAGIFHAIASKIFTMLHKIEYADPVMITGGCAMFDELVNIISNKTGKTIVKPGIDCRIFTAFGAALLAQGIDLKNGSRVL